MKEKPRFVWIERKDEGKEESRLIWIERRHKEKEKPVEKEWRRNQNLYELKKSAKKKNPKIYINWKK